MENYRQLWYVRRDPYGYRCWLVYGCNIFFPDDGRATNPSSTQEAIAQVCSRIPAPGVTLPLGIVIGLFRGSHLNSFTTHHI